MLNQVLDFIYKSPTPFQSVDNIKAILDKQGYKALDEKEIYQIEKNNKYYIVRNDSSIIIFNVGKDLNEPKFKIVASHNDCPTFKLKPNSIIKDGNYTKLNTEIYGGPLLNPWFDRPLSLAGRLMVKDNEEIKSLPFNLNEDFCIIPSLAIHQNREANSGFKNNPQTDLLPIISTSDFDFNKFLSEKCGYEVITYDLYLYPRFKPVIFNDLFSSYHIDNLISATLSFLAIMNNFDDDAINMAVIFDNEEVGSRTYQGADSDFLESNLKRIAQSLNIDYETTKARSYAISFDGAHAVHPAHPEKADPTNKVMMNKGIVIKSNANQSYTSDAYSTSIFVTLLNKYQIPYQFFTNRSDERGGSTLGNISNGHSSIRMIDIGLAQLAMHSCFETAGVKDVDFAFKALMHFYHDTLLTIK